MNEQQPDDIRAAVVRGDATQVATLMAQGADGSTPFGRRTLVQEAMRHGHVTVLEVLRAAGAAFPRGSTPPASLPDAVVLRNYLPVVAWGIAAAVSGATLVAGAVSRSVMGLIIGVVVLAATFAIVAVADVMVGRMRVAVQGPQLGVRQLFSWDGPIDLRRVDAIGLAPAVNNRMSDVWRFAQPDAGPRLGALTRSGFDPAQVADLDQRGPMRVLTVYCGRGFMSPGWERFLARHVDAATSQSATTRARFALQALR